MPVLYRGSAVPKVKGALRRSVEIEKWVWRGVKGSGWDHCSNTISLENLKKTRWPQSGIIHFKSKFEAKTPKIGERVLNSLSWLQSDITLQDSVAVSHSEGFGFDFHKAGWPFWFGYRQIQLINIAIIMQRKSWPLFSYSVTNNYQLLRQT